MQLRKQTILKTTKSLLCQPVWILESLAAENLRKRREEETQRPKVEVLYSICFYRSCPALHYAPLWTTKKKIIVSSVIPFTTKLIALHFLTERRSFFAFFFHGEKFAFIISFHSPIDPISANQSLALQLNRTPVSRVRLRPDSRSTLPGSHRGRVGDHDHRCSPSPPPPPPQGPPAPRPPTPAQAAAM